MDDAMAREAARLADPAWRRLGPYLSERQWGTVREDYSAGGDAWTYLPHDHARSRAYRWGEDGIAGFCDDKQRWCLGIALWNERDPILKERLFGLTNSEGNHGEDVKELYSFLDGVPSHAFMRMLYQYPQAAFPYAALIAENARRGLRDPEFEIADTGVFAEGRYFDVEVSYAKAAADDVLMRVAVRNRGPEPAALHVLAQLWSRNTWSWTAGAVRPQARLGSDGRVTTAHPEFPPMRFGALQAADWLFCENETNARRLYGEDAAGYFKDGIGDHVVHGEAAAVNPARTGSKCAARTRLHVPAGGEIALRYRYCADAAGPVDFDAVMAACSAEADAYYAAVQAGIEDPGRRVVHRQAIAGMLWSKQFYRIDIRRWLAGDPTMPPPPEGRRCGRDNDWMHLDASDVLSMPDTWEYPWFAAWDLAFHAVVFATVDPGFAKHQLLLLTREWYMHPNGQLPAYEWAFDDANPPVHAWAAWRVYAIDRERTGVADTIFLKRIFHKLMLNFTWWVNRKDELGRNIFAGGFLGLDNIGVFDRSRPVPGGGSISQSDGTAWMAMYALNLMQIALELADSEPVYEDVASKFFEHFLLIAEAMTDRDGRGDGLWDETDGFYYDVLDHPDGSRETVRLRSLVGLIPLLAVAVLDGASARRHAGFAARMRWMLLNRPGLAGLVSHWEVPGEGDTILLSLLRGHRLKALLRRMLDPEEFLSPHGVRSLSRVYLDAPYTLESGGEHFEVRYVAGCSDTRLFGGNSNWRGPLWMPLNVMLIEALRESHRYYGDEFVVEYPSGSQRTVSLAAVAEALTDRLVSLFLPDGSGVAPFARGSGAPPGGGVLFHEYFDGDTGQGLGASHQTGWTGLVAVLLGRPRG